jgi:DNA-directed RNA polymerase subunit RPC12/RpoP
MVIYKNICRSNGYMHKNKVKNCPKCGSRSLYLENDEGIISEHCFLCGYEVLLNGIQSIGEMENLSQLVEQPAN